jgi:hypothetical protein
VTAKHHVTEHVAIQQVVTRLAEAFTPALSDRQIDETVQRIHRGFGGSRIRDFIPLLVENAARRELRTLVQIPDTPSGPSWDAARTY